MPGFGERTFEFCYNREFCRRFGAMLAAAPYLPSLRAEKELGYDVAFRLRNGRFTRSLFLQHKVSSYAESRRWNNWQFYDCYHGPYFRFQIDTAQQNTLFDSFDPTFGDVFYCAPRFHLVVELDAHYRAETIMAHSVWVTPKKIGRIVDDVQHNVTYDITATSAHFHSDAIPVPTVVTKGQRLPHAPRRLEMSLEAAVAFAMRLDKSISLEKVPSTLRARLRDAAPIQRLQFILGRVLGLTWLILP